MIKADIYIKNTIKEIIKDGTWDKNPRPKWEDGAPAFSKFITQKVFAYDLDAGEFPITTLRNTAIRGAFYDIEAIYIKQTSCIPEMHQSIRNWWLPFSLKGGDSIGSTYGSTVKRWKLIDKLLEGLASDPFGRRHLISLWQEEGFESTPDALKPCAWATEYSIREYDCVDDPLCTIRMVDMTLIQRSQDYVMTMSINPAQYTMLLMMICGHLTFVTGIEHRIGKLLHVIQNCHIYDRHMWAAEELLERTPISIQPIIELGSEPKYFYDYTESDFNIVIPDGIKKLSKPLEMAV